jgi:hypothetical protein
MPDRHTGERRAAWELAQAAEASTEAGSDERRRATATTRRARWAHEDAVRLESEDRGIVESPPQQNDRILRRFYEAVANSNAVVGNPSSPDPHRLPAETSEQRTRRVADEREIAAELGEDESRSDDEAAGRQAKAT